MTTYNDIFLRGVNNYFFNPDQYIEINKKLYINGKKRRVSTNLFSNNPFIRLSKIYKYKNRIYDGILILVLQIIIIFKLNNNVSLLYGIIPLIIYLMCRISVYY